MRHAAQLAAEHRGARPRASQSAAIPRVPGGLGSAQPSLGNQAIGNQAMLRAEQAANQVAEEAVSSGEGVGGFFQSRFGLDIGGVALHTGPDAAASARSLGARAFTRGRDIVFGAGQYRSDTTEGRRLLAHELTHVVQQEGSSDRSFIQRQPDPFAGTESQGATGTNKPTPGTSWADTAEAQDEKKKPLERSEPQEEQKKRKESARNIQGAIQQNLSKAVEMLSVALLVTAENFQGDAAGTPDVAARKPNVPEAYITFAKYLALQPQTLNILLAEGKLRDYIAVHYLKSMSLGAFSKAHRGFKDPLCTDAGDLADLSRAFIEPEDPRDFFKPKPKEASAPTGPPGPTYEEWQQAQADTLDAAAGSPIGALLYYIGLSRGYGTMDMARFTSMGPALSGFAVGVAQLGTSPSLAIPDQRPEMIEESKSAVATPISVGKTTATQEVPKVPEGSPQADPMMTVYRGTVEPWRQLRSRNVHDLGPGTYFTRDERIGRTYAAENRGKFQTELLKGSGQTPAKLPSSPPGVVLKGQFSLEGLKVFDFYNNELQADFESYMRGEQPLSWGVPPPSWGEQGKLVVSGRGSAQTYNSFFEGWARAKGIDPEGYDVVIGPEYRNGGSQVVIKDPSLVKQVDEGAVVVGIATDSPAAQKRVPPQ